MKLSFDSQIFGAQRFGGIARYWSEILPRLAQDPEVEMSVDLGWYITRYPLSDSLSATARVCGRPAPFWAPSFLRHARNLCVSRFRGPVSRGSILHRTYYYEFMKVASGAHLAVTFFDLIQERFRRPGDERVLAAKRRSAETADLIFCISQATADDLRDTYGVSSDRIVVTHLGFAAQKEMLSVARPQERPYVLFVGLRDGYKNFSLVKEAFTRNSELGRDFDLVCFGGPPLRPDEWSGNGRVCRVTGSDQELARWYRHAACLVYPSRYEGFGLPLVEAMSQGCPVITSKGGSLCEVGGDAALYVDADDADHLAQMIMEIHAKHELRERMVAAGRKNIDRFTWEATAAKTLAGYRRLMG